MCIARKATNANSGLASARSITGKDLVMLVQSLKMPKFTRESEAYDQMFKGQKCKVFQKTKIFITNCFFKKNQTNLILTQKQT